MHDRAFVIIPIECSGANYIGDKNRNLGNKAVLLERDGKRDKLFQKIHSMLRDEKLCYFAALVLFANGMANDFETYRIHSIPDFMSCGSYGNTALLY